MSCIFTRYLADVLSAYVHTYIREEIKEEGLVRRTEPFIRFLEIAALSLAAGMGKDQPLSRGVRRGGGGKDVRRLLRKRGLFLRGL